MLATPGSFAWWDTHARAWRRARLLFVLAAGVVAIYVAGLVVVVGASLRAAGVGPWHRIDGWVHDWGPFGLSLAVLVLLTVAALAMTAIGWRGLPRATVRLSAARAPTGQEGHALGAAVASFAPAYGMSDPRIWVIDDPAPNALAFGRPTAGNVCVTTGALRLPGDELEALCQFHVTALASRSFAYASAAGDLVLLGEWCTRLLWASSAFAILSTVVGVPIAIAAAYVVGVVVVVLVTRPVLLVTDHGLVKLLDETAELIDLETVRHTAAPAPLARLLLDLLEDPHRVRSRWEIAHLWFERDVIDVVDGAGLARLFANTRSTRRGLLDRADTVVGQTMGDEKLRARLARARAATRVP